jgi:hypothetical protein
MTTTFPATPVRRTLLAALTGAAALLPLSAAWAQSQQPGTAYPPVPGARQVAAPVDPQAVSCNDLKTQLKGAGEMSILVGPRGGWGDTFYGPSVPRCQFYQMPQFAYVRARDGLCGVGYICVDKMSID